MKRCCTKAHVIETLHADRARGWTSITALRFGRSSCARTSGHKAASPGGGYLLNSLGDGDCALVGRQAIDHSIELRWGRPRFRHRLSPRVVKHPLERRDHIPPQLARRGPTAPRCFGPRGCPAASSASMRVAWIATIRSPTASSRARREGGASRPRRRGDDDDQSAAPWPADERPVLAHASRYLGCNDGLPTPRRQASRYDEDKAPVSARSAIVRDSQCARARAAGRPSLSLRRRFRSRWIK